MRPYFYAAALILSAAFSIPAEAHADPVYLFSASGSNSFSFSLPASPSNAIVDSDPSHFGFYLNDVPVDFNGAVTNLTIEFYETMSSGGFDLFDNGTTNYFAAISLTGPQLFSGSLSSPTFALGTFALSNILDKGSTYDLTVSQSTAPPPVPEPASWILFGTGIVGVCSSIRRRIHCSSQMKL